MLETWTTDLRHGARILRQARGLAAVVVLTFALAIGAAVATFSVLNATVLQALPYHQPERVVSLAYSYAGSPAAFSPPTFVDFRRETRAFESLSACIPWDTNLTGTGEPERVHGLLVSASFFETLGASAWQGRTFSAGEEQPGHEHVVVISHGLWQRRFAGNPAALGGSIRLNGESYEVVGIMPTGFRWGRGWGHETQGDVWAPFALTPARIDESERGDEYLDVYARLRPNTSQMDARQDVQTVMAGLRRRFPDRYAEFSGWRVAVVGLQEAIVAPLRPGLLLLFAAVALLLLVAAANVAGLLVARAASRRRETSVRAALGATPFRLARETLAEAAVLSALGGALGLVLARLAVAVLEQIDRATLPRSTPFAIDARVLAFALAVTALAALTSGIVPAWHTSRARLVTWLRGAACSAGGAEAHRARRVLVVAQTAMALALLVGAGLLARSLVELHRVPVGFRAADVLTGRVQLPRSRYSDLAARRGFVEAALRKAVEQPGVSMAGVVSDLPLSDSSNSSSFEIEGRPEAAAGQGPHAETWSATPAYFATLGIPLRRGRWIEPSDRPESAPVAVVNEALVRRHFPGEDPLGRRIDFEGSGEERAWRTIVGVVGDVRDRGLDRPPEPQVYVPYSQRPTSGLFLAVRTSAEPATLAPALRATIHAADPELALFDVATMSHRTDEDAHGRQTAQAALAAFAAAAVALAALGLYGVVAQSVRERSTEIGVRLALGAQRRHVIGLVLGEGGRLLAGGLALGSVLALAASRLLRGLVFGITPADPLTYASMALTLAAVGLAACAVPAWRASRADPIRALRAE
jgi:putative ABC transport system permease protein